jgi:hypothetical protein
MNFFGTVITGHAELESAKIFAVDRFSNILKNFAQHEIKLPLADAERNFEILFLAVN